LKKAQPTKEKRLLAELPLGCSPRLLSAQLISFGPPSQRCFAGERAQSQLSNGARQDPSFFPPFLLSARSPDTREKKRATRSEIADELHPIAEALFSSGRKERKNLVERCDMRGQNEIQKLPAARRMPAKRTNKTGGASVKNATRGMLVPRRSAKDCPAALDSLSRLRGQHAVSRQEMAR